MRRHGYTLLELVLVLAVIVIVATLSMPAIDALLASNKVSAARDMVRTQWAEMRARALEEGRPYRFAVTENTGKFRVAPDDDAYWGGASHQDQDPEDTPLIIEGELPEGVLFTTSEAAFAGTELAPAPGPEWGLTIAVYLADGIARDDAEVYFGKAGQRALGLRLRGLTGAVTAIEPSKNNGEVPP
ncbi:MAG: prepilin-type N-terminal cleavage/methylation domain-containing protein [Gemmataceae bacterium]|nr:prepilin-type N-terminal cleavage/methylation domain-containing protein [Gemmataceae bacterium]